MEIKSSIENLYKTFAQYNIKGNLRDRSCNCCVTKSNIKTLLSKPLQKLSEDDLGHFIRKAITTFGDEKDYKHFLPRILELLNSNDNLLDEFLTFEKLRYTKWNSWSQKEINAIENYFLALWVDVLRGDSNQQLLKQVFILVLEYIDSDKVFKEWEKYFAESNVKIILDYILRDFNIPKTKDRVFNNWLSSNKVLVLLEKLYSKIDKNYLANEISIVYTILDKRKLKK